MPKPGWPIAKCRSQITAIEAQPMINKIKQFFSDHIASAGNDSDAPRHTRAQIAAAALFVEVMVIDARTAPEEENTIKNLLKRQFGLSATEAEELLNLARQEVGEATSLYQFTGLVNEQFSASEKFDLLTQIWQVALADGLLDKYEEGLIRRLADLLHIDHSQYIKAKHRAREFAAKNHLTP
ncbi:MAG TPA: hypothetical protein DCF62_05500 [Porticoccaceae bacterium]|nr:hypothetical protein [Porticoccaceae bacterium]